MSWTYLLWDGKTYACPPCEWLLLWPTYTFPLRHRLMLLLLHLASWFGLKQCSDNEQRCDSAHLHLQVRRCLCSPLTFCFSPSLPVFFFGLLNCLVSVSVNCSPSLCLSYKHVVATFSGAALQASGFAAAAGLRSYAQAYQASSPTHQSRRRASPLQPNSHTTLTTSNKSCSLRGELFRGNSGTVQTWQGCSHKPGTPQKCQACGRQSCQVTRRRNKLARLPSLQTCSTRRPVLHAAKERRRSSSSTWHTVGVSGTGSQTFDTKPALSVLSCLS